MRQNNFDILRFYFAFIVVIGHLIEISGVREFQPYGVFFDTNTSVTAFFVISGFLIAKSYLKSDSLKQYFKKRAARILPAYLVVVVFFALIFSLHSNLSLVSYFSHAELYKYLISNLSFMNFIQPCLPGVFEQTGINCDVNGALWTLKIEVAFYLSVPVIIYFLEKTKRKWILLSALYISSIIYETVLIHISNTTGNNLYLMLSRQLPGFISYFASGIAIYYYYDRFLQFKTPALVLGIALILIEKWMELSFFTPAALAFIVFFFAFSFKSFNGFAKFGDFSYGIYILHCPIIKYFTSIGAFNTYNPYIVSLLVILCVIVLSVASWYFIEKPALAKVRK